tara:strand:+ start:273 stop:485 length:213 start_codon:yes stop_codon:yes gene_type:complete
MERAKEVRIYRQKTFDELQNDIKGANEKVKKYMPPSNKKKKTEDAPVQLGVTDKSFDKGGITGNVFKKSF